MSLNQHTGIDEFKPTYGYWCTCHISVYTPGKKYCNTLIFSLDKIVRRKCSIIGRNLLKILPECFKLNHWYIERHTLHSKIEIKCCTIHKLKMCHFCDKKNVTWKLLIALSRIPSFKHNLYSDRVISLWNFKSSEKS